MSSDMVVSFSEFLRIFYQWAIVRKDGWPELEVHIVVQMIIKAIAQRWKTLYFSTSIKNYATLLAFMVFTVMVRNVRVGQFQ